MHRQDINAALRKRYGSAQAFERDKGLPERSVRDVLRGRAVAQTERALAAELGKPLHQLFPLRYEEPAASDGPDSSPYGDDNGAGESPMHRLSAER